MKKKSDDGRDRKRKKCGDLPPKRERNRGLPPEAKRRNLSRNTLKRDEWCLRKSSENRRCPANRNTLLNTRNKTECWGKGTPSGSTARTDRGSDRTFRNDTGKGPKTTLCYPRTRRRSLDITSCM